MNGWQLTEYVLKSTRNAIKTESKSVSQVNEI